MSKYFAEPKSPGGRENVELDLPNYATKADLKNGTDVYASKFAKKVDLESFKCNADKLDIDKLKIAPTSLRDVVQNDVVKKDVYNAKIKNIEDEIPDITSVATNTPLNA